MNGEPLDLPIFARPPVDEVAMGVQFPPIPGFLDTHAGLYWQRIRQEYPQVQIQPRLEGPIESPGPPPQTMQLQIPLSNVSQNRTWLISSDDEYLIQIQNTRFVCNWRRREAPYPRFERLVGLFINHLDQFLGLLQDESLERPTLQQVEVSYINWIPALPISDFLKVASSTTIKTPDGEKSPEDQTWAARYLLEGKLQDTKRLYVQCGPAIQPQTPSIRGSQLSLSFKAARADGLMQNEVSSLVREGRVLLVGAFTELTTPEAHKVWERVR